jgi:hypothetical protein
MSTRRAELAIAAYQAKGGEGSKMAQDDLTPYGEARGFEKLKCKGVAARCKGVLRESQSQKMAVSEAQSGGGLENG